MASSRRAQAAGFGDACREGIVAPVEGATVLLVDDEPLLLSLMARELEDAGYFVHTARGGPEALELLDRLPIAPVVLVTDLRMEPMDGADLARNVQARHPAGSTGCSPGRTRRSMRIGIIGSSHGTDDGTKKRGAVWESAALRAMYSKLPGEQTWSRSDPAGTS